MSDNQVNKIVKALDDIFYVLCAMTGVLIALNIK